MQLSLNLQHGNLLDLALGVNRRLFLHFYIGVKVDPYAFTGSKPSGDLFFAPGLVMGGLAIAVLELNINVLRVLFVRKAMCRLKDVPSQTECESESEKLFMILSFND